jgi:hypothetical protein
MHDGLVVWSGRSFMVRPDRWPSGARYKVRDWAQVACWVVGEHVVEVNADDDDLAGYEETGLVGVVMVGDDYAHLVDPDDLVRISRADYCGECGQIGCAHGADQLDDEADEAEAEAAEADACNDEHRRTASKW